MGVFQCTKPNGSWDNIETAHDCLAELYEALATNGIVLGSILMTRCGENAGVREVTGRIGTIITPRTYSQINEATIRFVEWDGASA